MLQTSIGFGVQLNATCIIVEINYLFLTKYNKNTFLKGHLWCKTALFDTFGPIGIIKKNKLMDVLLAFGDGGG